MAPLPPRQRGVDTALPDTEQVRDVSDTVSGLVRDEPLYALAVAALVVLVLVVAAVVYRRRRSAGARFQAALADLDRVTVLAHPNPDPDALACGVGVARLAEAVGTEANLYYTGQIRHQENRAFRTVLDLNCEPVDDADDLDGDPVVLVDHNEPRGFPGAETVTPYAVVDHHPGEGDGTAFTDVRPEYGACATILSEYFDELDVDLPDPERDDDPAGPMDSDVATGLLYGILADTKHLTSGCSAAEFRAARYLYPGVDEDTLDRIANPQVDAEVLDVKSRAIADREVRAPFAVADVGEVSNADAIPQAADELVRLEGVSAVVVLGHRDGICQLSGRSRDDRVHMGDTLRVAVDDLPDASAGGHARMGGGRLRRDGVERGALVERLFEAMNGER